MNVIKYIHTKLFRPVVYLRQSYNSDHLCLSNSEWKIILKVEVAELQQLNEFIHDFMPNVRVKITHIKYHQF